MPCHINYESIDYMEWYKLQGGKHQHCSSCDWIPIYDLHACLSLQIILEVQNCNLIHLRIGIIYTPETLLYTISPSNNKSCGLYTKSSMSSSKLPHSKFSSLHNECPVAQTKRKKSDECPRQRKLSVCAVSKRQQQMCMVSARSASASFEPISSLLLKRL